MRPYISPQQLRTRTRRLTLLLLCIWLVTIAFPAFYARELSQRVPGWPLHYWASAQGALLVFLVLVVTHAYLVNRWESMLPPASEDEAASRD